MATTHSVISLTSGALLAAAAAAQTSAQNRACDLRIENAAAAGKIALRVDNGAARQPIAILLGTDSGESPLAVSGCRLALDNPLIVPLHRDGAGAATLALDPASVPPGLFAQAAQAGAALRLSPPIAVEPAPRLQHEGELLAQVDLGDGNRVLFIEVEPGELLVAAGGSGPKPPWLEAHRTGQLDAVTLYETTSGLPAPATLRAAQARADDAARQSPLAAVDAATDVSVDPPRAPMLRGGCMSSSWFINNHCTGNPDFSYCWTNLTGNPYVQRYCLWMWAVTACVSGTYEFEFRYKKLGTWRTSFRVRLYDCEWYYASGSGARRSRRAHVLYGTGDLKHFSVRGDT